MDFRCIVENFSILPTLCLYRLTSSPAAKHVISHIRICQDAHSPLSNTSIADEEALPVGRRGNVGSEVYGRSDGSQPAQIVWRVSGHP